MDIIEQTNVIEPGSYENFTPKQMSDAINADVMDEISTSNDRLVATFERNERRRLSGNHVHPAFVSTSDDHPTGNKNVYNPLLNVGTSRQQWYKRTIDPIVGMQAIPTPHPDNRGLTWDSNDIVILTFVYQH